MAKAPRERTSSVTELAEFAGVSRQAIYDWMKLPGFPIAPDGTVAKWELCQWYLTRLDPSSETEGETSGGDSPGLERYRLARAAQEEIKLGEMRKQFLDRVTVHSRLQEIASLLRGCGEDLQRLDNGNDALRILDERLDEIEKKIDEWFPDSNS